MSRTAARAVPASAAGVTMKRFAVPEIITEDLDLSNLQFAGEDSEIGRVAAAESIRRQLYDLGERDDDEQEDSIMLGDLEDIEGNRHRSSRRNHQNNTNNNSKNNRAVSGSSGSSSEDFDGGFDMRLNAQRPKASVRLQDYVASSDEENNNNDGDDLSIGTLSRHSLSPTLSPRRPPIIVGHVRVPAAGVDARDRRTSPTSAFDGLSQGLRKEFERNFPPTVGVATTTTTVASEKMLDRSSAIGGGTGGREDAAKRVFGQPIGNVINSEGDGHRRPLTTTARVSKEDLQSFKPASLPSATVSASASNRSALPPKARPTSTFYSTSRPAVFGPTPPAPAPSLASVKSSATTSANNYGSSSRLRPTVQDENIRPSTSYTSSTPAPASRGASISRHAIVLESPTPASPSYDYSQRIRNNNAGRSDVDDDDDDESLVDDGLLRLPDVTGLTEGMMSPEKPRGHYPLREAINTEVKATSLLDQLHARARISNDQQQQRNINELQSQLDVYAAREREREKDLRAQSDRYGNDARRESDQRAHESNTNRSDMERLRNQIAHLEAQATANAHLGSDVGDIRIGLDRVAKKVIVLREDVDVLTRKQSEQTAGRNSAATTTARKEFGVQASAHVMSEYEQMQERRRRSDGVSQQTLGRRAQSISSIEDEDEDEDRTPRASRYTNVASRKDGRDSRTAARSGAYHRSDEVDNMRDGVFRDDARKSPSPAPRRLSRPSRSAYDAAPVSSHHAHFAAPPVIPRYESYTFPHPTRTNENYPISQTHHHYHQHPPPTHSEDEERTQRANRIFESLLPARANPSTPALRQHRSTSAPVRCNACGQAGAAEPIDQTRSAPAKMTREDRERDEEAARERVAKEERMRRREKREIKEIKARQVQRDEVASMVGKLEMQFGEHKLMYDQVSAAYGKMEIEGQRSATAAHLHLCIDGLEFEAASIVKYRRLLEDLNTQLHQYQHHRNASLTTSRFDGPIPIAERRGEGIV